VSGDRFERVRELFIAAFELTPDRRAEFLDEACGDDAGLRAEVEELLGFHRDEETGLAERTPLRSVMPDRSMPEVVDRYRLLQKLGEGGMGEVYEAEQREPVHRRVALKIIKWGMDTEQVVARFASERQALALMDHSCIARVFDGGSTDQGRPYFVMELVHGVPVTEYCDQQRLGPRARLQLFARVCQGVQHAHQKGVIHRDLKPSNILVTAGDDGPVPKIIDFGIAKATSQRLTERTVFTELGQWIGTPEYMSPEQAELTGLDIDTRTDVYSLGVLLYELLVGAKPFDAEALRSSGFDEMRRRIREQEPQRPSTRVSTLSEASTKAAAARDTDPATLRRALRGDLDWIVMKALEKDRNRRYGSPAELAADIERHLSDQPVVAGPPSAVYRVGKFVRRNRTAVIATSLILVAMVAGLAMATVGMVRARRAEGLANTQVELLIGLFDTLDPGGESGGGASAAELLGEAETRIGEGLSAEPSVQARLQETIGRIYMNMGDHDQARRVLEESLAIRRRELGPDHPEVAESLQTLGILLGIMGDSEAAIVSLREALDVTEATFGPDHPRTAEVMNALAFELWRDGRYQESQRLFDRALPIREAALGSDHLAVGDSLFMQAVLLRDMGEYDRARLGFERALEIREAILGPDHTQIAWTLVNYGYLLALTGDPAGARQHYERALRIQNSVFGPDHFTMLEPTIRLAHLDAVEGELDRARRRLEQAQAVQEQWYGPDHHFLSITAAELGWLAYRSGDFETALTMFGRGRELLEAEFGPAAPRVARARLDVAWAHVRLGHQTEARRLYRDSVATEVARLEHGAVDAGRRYWNLGCMAALLGERNEAVDWLGRALVHGIDPELLVGDADLDGLRGDSGFEELVAEVRSSPQQAAGGWRPPAGSAGDSR
jgi:tetratricopeptide (TPR) repeat protein